MRDSLSLFDQAIAQPPGPVRAEDVRQMLGLADRTRVIDLFEALMRADIARSACKELRDQYDSGADPAMVLGDLAEFTHFVTRVKIVPSLADDVSLTEAERTRGRAFATKLSMRVLARTWQMLLKGIPEVRGRGPADRCRRNGFGAHRLCRRSADARRSHPLARRYAKRQRRFGHAALPRKRGGQGPAAAASGIALGSARGARTAASAAPNRADVGAAGTDAAPAIDGRLARPSAGVRAVNSSRS